MLFSKLAVYAKWKSLQKNEVYKMDGILPSCKWKQPPSAHIWNSQFHFSIYTTGTPNNIAIISNRTYNGNLYV